MSTFSKIFKILDAKDKKYLVILFIIITITTIAELINLGSIIALANFILNEKKFVEFISENLILRKFFNEINYDKLPIILITCAIIILFIKSILLLFFFWVKNRFLFHYEVKLKNRIFKNYLNQNYNFFLKNDQSELIRNINTEVGNFRFIALQVPVQIIFDFLIIIFISISLIIIKPIETITLVLGFSLMLILYFLLIKNKIKKWSEKRFESENSIIKNLLEVFSIIKEVLIYKNTKKFIKKNYNDNSRLANINVINYFIAEVPKHLLEFVGIFIILIYLYFLSAIQNERLENSIFILTIFSISIYRVLPSFLKIINGFQSLRFGKPSVDIIFKDAISLEKENSYLTSNQKILFNNTIEVKNLNIQYKDKNLYKENLNFQIKKDEKILIVGPSGSGKTTLLLMLAGLITPSFGKIYSDDKNIYNNLNEWQKKISWVDQKTVLLDETIKNNVTIMEDDNEIDETKLLETIKFVNLNQINLNKKVGEKSKFISGGEAQRISLARGIYKNTEILLLDEFTSNLDDKNISDILKKIKLINNKTIIAISHNHNLENYFDRKIEIC